MILRQVAEERGIKIMYSAAIQMVEKPATVVLGDGKRMEADLVIGADGKMSTYQV
jgi:2-polyprenyl-6-methoxyphenol hydroxylase-like FAD-dependent oxidoreductase